VLLCPVLILSFSSRSFAQNDGSGNGNGNGNGNNGSKSSKLILIEPLPADIIPEANPEDEPQITRSPNSFNWEGAKKGVLPPNKESIFWNRKELSKWLSIVSGFGGSFSSKHMKELKNAKNKTPMDAGYKTVNKVYFAPLSEEDKKPLVLPNIPPKISIDDLLVFVPEKETGLEIEFIPSIPDRLNIPTEVIKIDPETNKEIRTLTYPAITPEVLEEIYRIYEVQEMDPPKWVKWVEYGMLAIGGAVIVAVVWEAAAAYGVFALCSAESPQIATAAGAFILLLSASGEENDEEDH
jgi:hypothetical protein